MYELIDSNGEVISPWPAGGFIRAPYDGTRLRLIPEDYGPSLTVQSAAEEADLNVLVARWTRTGSLPEIKPLSFGDVSEAGSYVDVVEKLKFISDKFMELPAPMREFFNNDASVFADWVSDPANVDEGREIGLFAPAEVEVVASAEGGTGGSPPA